MANRIVCLHGGSVPDGAARVALTAAGFTPVNAATIADAVRECRETEVHAIVLCGYKSHLVAEVVRAIQSRCDASIVVAADGSAAGVPGATTVQGWPAVVAALLGRGTQGQWRQAVIGSSPPMQRVAEVIELVASRRTTVLLTGETGTGKEVVARAIHAAGARRDAPFVAVNCGAIPANLVEAELFGHTKGAFTGAVQSKPGCFEQANGGTVLLDEIGELPPEAQVKLLRVLQEREVQRVGGATATKINIRVIAATNIDLAEAVADRRFREDLFYRLNVVPLRLPPLRERRSDIPALAHHLLAKICVAEELPLKTLDAAAVRHLCGAHWPGNVRQLEHAIEMAVILSGARDTLTVDDFPAAPGVKATPVERPDIILPEEGLDFDRAVSRLERTLIEQALRRSLGNKARAADLLQMKRTTLLAKLKSLGMTVNYGPAAEVA